MSIVFECDGGRLGVAQDLSDVMLLMLASAAAVSVPFAMHDDRIIVQAMLNGSGPFAFIVDTGVNGIAITPQVARRLHLRLSPGPKITGAGANAVAAPLATVSQVALGARDFGSQRAVVVDLDPIRHAFAFPKLDGILGYDVIASRYLRVDNDHHVLTISRTPIAAPSDAHHVTYAVQDGLLQVPGSVDGVQGTFVIDTGDRSALTLFAPFARRNNFYDIEPAQHNVVTGRGIGGPIRSNVFDSRLEAFGFAISGVVTRVPLGNAGVFSTGSQAGSIGNAVLSRFNTIYDSAAHTITVWPAHNAPPPQVPQQATLDLPRHGIFGAAMVDRPAGATIARVIPGTAAARTGAQVGDVIRAVNGAQTPNVAAFLAQMHRLRAGQEVAVAFNRAGNSQSLHVTLGTPANENDPGLTTIYGTVEVDGSLRRTLTTLPAQARGRLPAMLLLGGIGCYTVDAAANPQDPYMRLTHDVSRAGFVTMRLEKSGVGDSQGPPCASVDLSAEERGYAAALTALRNSPRVDPSRIYLFGHSIGSIEAPRLAALQPVAGIIIAEGVGRDWPEYEVRNLRRQLEVSGSAPSDVDAALIGKQTCMVRLLLEKQPEEQIEQSEPDCKTHNGVYPVAAPYMQQAAAINIIDAWAHINVPMLAIYGSSDVVTEQADHERIVAVVNARHPGSATFHPIEGMDHFFAPAATPKASMDAVASGAPRPYDSDLSSAVVDWLTKREGEHRSPSAK